MTWRRLGQMWTVGDLQGVLEEADQSLGYRDRLPSSTNGSERRELAILRQGDAPTAAIQSDLTDAQVLALRDDLSEWVGGICSAQ